MAFTGPQEFYQLVAATQVNTPLSFGFDVSNVLFVNAGPQTVYITVSALIATTSMFPLNSGEQVAVTLNNPSEGAGLICAAGQTASVRVWALQ